MIDQETIDIIEIEIIPTIGIETTIQMNETKDIKKIHHVNILTTDQIIKNQVITTIKINHAIIHKIETQTIKIEKETNLNQYIGITHVIQILNKTYGSNTPKHQRQIN